MAEQHEGLPVSGYRPQPDEKGLIYLTPDENVTLVNENKATEERLLRLIDDMVDSDKFDRRWLAIARIQLEQGFMALNRAVFQPARIKLPGDPQS